MSRRAGERVEGAHIQPPDQAVVPPRGPPSQDDDPQAMEGGGHRGREAAGARPNHQDVGVQGQNKEDCL